MDIRRGIIVILDIPIRIVIRASDLPLARRSISGAVGAITAADFMRVAGSMEAVGVVDSTAAAGFTVAEDFMAVVGSTEAAASMAVTDKLLCGS